MSASSHTFLFGASLSRAPTRPGEAGFNVLPVRCTHWPPNRGWSSSLRNVYERRHRMVTHAAIFDFAREMTAELLEKLPSTSRTRLSTKRYWREVTLSLFELFGAVMIWRGLWDAFDIIYGSDVVFDGIQAMTGLFIVVSAGVINVVGAGMEGEERERESEGSVETEADFPERMSPEEVINLFEEPVLEASLSGEQAQAASKVLELKDYTRQDAYEAAEPQAGPSSAAWRYSFLSDTAATMRQRAMDYTDDDERNEDDALVEVHPMHTFWRPFSAFQDTDRIAESTSGAPGAGPVARLVWERLPAREQRVRARGFFKLMSLRRSVRSFSEDDVPLSVIEDCVRVAACAPSGGHLQPWTFVVVQDAEVKRALRAALEEREQREHARQRVCGDAEREPAASAKYTSSGNPFSRPYVSEAPYVIVVMQHRWREAQPTRSPGHVDLPSNPRASWGSPTPTLAASSPIVAPGDHAQQAGAEPPGVSGAHGAGGMEAAVAVRPNGVLGPDEAALSTDEMAAKGRAGPRERVPVRNSTESCGIAVGMLVAALHNANLATVVTTPRGCDGAIRELLGRPSSERVFAVMPVGFPSDDCEVPYRKGNALRKSLTQVALVV